MKIYEKAKDLINNMSYIKKPSLKFTLKVGYPVLNGTTLYIYFPSEWHMGIAQKNIDSIRMEFVTGLKYVSDVVIEYMDLDVIEKKLSSRNSVTGSLVEIDDRIVGLLRECIEHAGSQAELVRQMGVSSSASVSSVLNKRFPNVLSGFVDAIEKYAKENNIEYSIEDNKVDEINMFEEYHDEIYKQGYYDGQMYYLEKMKEWSSNKITKLTNANNR